MKGINEAVVFHLPEELASRWGLRAGGGGTGTFIRNTCHDCVRRQCHQAKADRHIDRGT